MTTLPVLSHFLVFERILDERLALSAWRSYVTAHGWSVVGEPVLYPAPEGHVVEGRIVKTDEPRVIAVDVAWVAFP